MKRGLLIGSGVVVIAIVAIVFFVFSSLDGLIKDAVEKYGSEITKAKVSLNEVKVDIGSGKGALSGLNVGNPAGFKTPSAFKLGGISVNIDTGTVTSDPVVIKEIVIDAPEVTYELSGSGSNIAAIQKNVESYMSQFGGGGDKAAKKDDGEGPKLVIENLYVRGGKVNVSANIPLMEGKSLGAPLPDIHLKDIGKEDKGDGATPAEVAEKVLTSIGDSAKKAVGGLGIGESLDSLKKSLGGMAEGAGKAITEGAGSAGESITKGVEGAGDKLKKMFGK